MRREVVTAARGSVLVEFAITLPFLVLVMSALYQLSLLLSMYGPSGNVAYLAAMTGAEIPNSVGVTAMEVRGSELMANLNERHFLQQNGMAVTASYGADRTSTATVTAASIEIFPGFSAPMSATFTVPVLAKAVDAADTGFGYEPVANACGAGATGDCDVKDEFVESFEDANGSAKEVQVAISNNKFLALEYSLKTSTVDPEALAFQSWASDYVSPADGYDRYIKMYGSELAGSVDEGSYVKGFLPACTGHDVCWKALVVYAGWDSNRGAPWIIEESK